VEMYVDMGQTHVDVEDMVAMVLLVVD